FRKPTRRPPPCSPHCGQRPRTTPPVDHSSAGPLVTVGRVSIGSSVVAGCPRCAVEGGAVAVRIRDHRTPILAVLTLTLVIPVYGKLSDLYGRKPVLVIGVLVFLAGSALSAAAWDMLALPLFRALQGRGAGSIGATVNTVAGDLYEVSERGRIQGFLSSVWGISAVVAPAVRGRPDDNRSVADTTGCLQPTKPGKSRTASGRYEPAIELVDMRSQAVDRLGTVDHEVMLSSPNQGWP